MNVSCAFVAQAIGAGMGSSPAGWEVPPPVRTVTGELIRIRWIKKTDT